MALAYDALPPQLAALARDVDGGVDHGARWFSLLAGVKHRAVTMAKSVVDDAVLVAGGSSYFAASELGRLYRDVLAGHVPPLRPGVRARHGRERLARPARGLTRRGYFCSNVEGLQQLVDRLLAVSRRPARTCA